ncbi:MAG: dTDP-4-dehydrorhamnose 3,5-epimerase [Chloroflexota bacterium]|nr:dTDP-4-dehydrorhamnose 3,5-epimerase [Chloroflexia bacterium]MDQ3444126.1 dTDP-4-dehydrorhamnose 3,5-epimerase [Chloroflexota bacterium]
MNILATPLAGVIIIEPKIFGDARGFFVETWQAERYAEAGLPAFVQDNLSRSSQGVLRGLHYQEPDAQGKLVQVLEGEVFDVAVDIRVGSDTFGTWHGVTLSSENKRQFYVPAGFAHGFVVISESALFAYKCTELYRPEHDHSLRWDDPDIGIDWPVDAPSLSTKDADAPRLAAIARDELPTVDAYADPKPR